MNEQPRVWIAPAGTARPNAVNQAGDPVTLSEDGVTSWNPVVFDSAARRFREGVLGIFAVVEEALPTLRKVHGQLVEAGLVEEQPPTDPKARALWLRQHRNTGPAVPKDWRKR